MEFLFKINYLLIIIYEMNTLSFYNRVFIYNRWTY